jgi:ATP-binding cassette subfamily B protein
MAKKTERQTNFERETLAIFWKAIWDNKPYFLRSLLHSIGVICINVLTPLLISMTLAGLAVRKGDVGGYILPLAIVAAVGVLCNWYGFTNLLLLHARAQSDLLELSMSTLLHRSVGFHANTIGGKLVNNALEYPAAFGRLVDAIYVNLVPFFLTMVFGISVVLLHSPAMGLALLTVTVTIIILTIRESRRRAALRIQRKVAQNTMIAHVSDTLVNAQAVKTFARETSELKQHRKLSDTLVDLRFRDWSMTARSGSKRMGVLLALEIAFIAFVGYLVSHDPSVLAIGIFSFSYMITMTNRLFDIGTMIRNIEEAFVSAASMTEILLQETEIVDKPHAKPVEVNKGKIQLDNVHFAYHDDSSSENVFDNLSLTIPAGEKIGLVGPSGGGKSTLTRLLLRFDDVDDGAILIDGQDIRDVTQASLRQAISYVPQEPLLFHRSILENIAYGKPDATVEQVREAAKLAYADEFISRLPQGYETIVGERGVKLSGGQRQRVAIARAILKDAPILILDEATSALDSESEVYIQKALEQLMQNRTTIVIAHRLSTIQKLDRIIVLDGGEIVEDGTHQSLQKQSGLYAKLWAHQSGGFIED